MIDAAYVSPYAADDVSAWSGIAYFMARAVDRPGIRLRFVGPVRSRLQPTLKAARVACRAIGNRQLMYDREPAYLKRLASHAERQLRTGPCDVILSPSTIPIAYLRVRPPVVFWTDATFAGMVDFYPHLTHLLRRSIKYGHAMERMAIANATAAVYSSDWAAQSAIRDYGADPSRVHVVPFGANLKHISNRAQVTAAIERRLLDRCDLLFVGVDWARKGADAAVKVAVRLNQRGLPTTLTIIGCRPPRGNKLPPFVFTPGFVDKADGSGDRTIEQWMSGSHFLILPARADATPIVCSEANAFGVPVLATNVGGLSSIVRDDVNGKLFGSPPISVDRWCDYIMSVLQTGRYASLGLSSRMEYETRLNWGVAGRAMEEILMTAVGG